MSLQTGAEIARTSEAIIDPAVLDVIAYHVAGPRLEANDTILLTNDIREVSDIGFIVDSADELTVAEDVIKVQKVLALHFQLIGLDVVDDRKHKLGKLYNYTIDPLSFTIHQLYIRRPLLRSLQTSDLIINRSQIIEVNNKSVIVRSASLDERSPAPAIAEGFINPFRSPSSPSDASEIND